MKAGINPDARLRWRRIRRLQNNGGKGADGFSTGEKERVTKSRKMSECALHAPIDLYRKHRDR